jgi:hypothetical protein
MKIRFLFSFCCLVAIQSFATIRTVSNNPSTIAQFSTIQAAINASSSGDTIEIMGSPYNYVNASITDKKLTLIGPGFAPDKDFGLRATIVNLTISGEGTSNSAFQGLRIVENVFIGGTVYPQGISFTRNIFDGTFSSPNLPTIQFTNNGGTFKNFLFEGNVFNGYGILSQSYNNFFENFLFRNNYFFMNGQWYNSGLLQRIYNCTNVTFDHNLWMGPSNSNDYAPNGFIIIGAEVGSSRFLTFTNNIFFRLNVGLNGSQNYFSNNITFDASNNTPWLSNGNVDGGGNIANTNPEMAAQASVNAGTFNPIADYTIASGPANNAGSDGKDIGLLYDAIGSYNWANARNSRLPRISKMKVLNSTVAEGGTITVAVEAKTSN